MSEKTKKTTLTPRDHYIISQALYVAIDTLSRVPMPEREISNIDDMNFLMETLFPLYPAVVEATKLAKAANQ